MLEFMDNRLSGLLREVQEAIEDTEDADTLWRLHISLRSLHRQAREKGWLIRNRKRPLTQSETNGPT